MSAPALHGGFYILSLKHTRPGLPCVWECPGRVGYTRYVDEAGVFTADQMRDPWEGRGLKGPAARAVPAAEVARRTSPAPDFAARTAMRRPGAPVVPFRHFRHLNKPWEPIDADD